MGKHADVEGYVRHDFLIPKKHLGKAIGPKGAFFRGLFERTSCHIFIMDSRAPPNEPNEARQISLVGRPTQVKEAYDAYYELLDGGSEMLNTAKVASSGDHLPYLPYLPCLTYLLTYLLTQGRWLWGPTYLLTCVLTDLG